MHFVQLLGGICLFLYGIQIACYNLEQLVGSGFKRFLDRLTKNRIKSFLTGIGVTAILQSSSASTVMVVSLVGLGILGFEQVLGFLLGAGIGSTFTAQLISFRLGKYSLIFIIIGFLLSSFYRKTGRNFGLIILGFGFVFFSMNLMGQATETFKQNTVLMQILGFLGTSPFWGFVFGTLFTAMVQGSAVSIGVFIIVARTGLLSVEALLPFILGANVGTCMTALLGSLKTNAKGKQVAFAFLFFKFVGAMLFFPFLPYFYKLVVLSSQHDVHLLKLEHSTVIGHQIANAHTLFNIIIALIFLPGIHLWGKLIQKVFPIYFKEEGFQPLYLDEGALTSPAFALGQVTREVLRMAEIVQNMLRQSLICLKKVDEVLINKLEQVDDHVDLLNKSIKLYLAKISQENLTEAQAKIQQELLTLAVDLENIADLITRNILKVARKKMEKGLRFSDEGFNEIKTFYDKVLDNFKISMSAFTTNNKELANIVLKNQHDIQNLEFQLRQTHFDRLRQGTSGTVETTSLHLDLLALLKTINNDISNVAYLILERV